MTAYNHVPGILSTGAWTDKVRWQLLNLGKMIVQRQEQIVYRFLKRVFATIDGSFAIVIFGFDGNE